MIDKLTSEQVALMETVKNEWLDLIFKPSQPNKEKIIDGVKWLYTFSGLKEPNVVIVSSPYGAQLAVNMLGQRVRNQVWDQVGDQVRDQVWDQVRNQVWDQVRNQVRNQVWDQVRNQVRNQVWDQVGDQVWDQVESQVWSQVRSQVWSQVWSQVESQVESQMKLNYHPFSVYGSAGDFGWLSFYDFFEKVGIEYKNDAYLKFKGLMQSGVYDMIQLDRLCVVCTMPRQVIRDEQHRLHSSEGMAISWDDGYGQHYLYGVYFPEGLWKQAVNPNVNPKDIIAIKNAEQRMAAMKHIGMGEFLDLLGAKLLSETDRGNKLYLVTGLFSRPAYFVGMTCPSTGRVYLEGVDPGFAQENPNADMCQAYNLGLTIEEYQELGWEA